MHARLSAASRRRRSPDRTPRPPLLARGLVLAVSLAVLALPAPILAGSPDSDAREAAFAPVLRSLEPGPPPAGAALHQGRGIFEGTLERLVEETVRVGRSIERFILHTPSGSVELQFAGQPPLDFANGAKVRVHGRLDGTVISVDPATAAIDAPASTEVLVAAPGAGTGVRRVAVVPINFTNDRSRPFSRAYAAGIVFNNTRSARSYFGEESKGRVTLEGTTFDWIALPLSNTSCDYRGWATAARQILSDRGVDVASFTNLVFAFPQTSACPWRGLGHLPGWHTWVNGTPSLRTVVHELGHNFGAHHASTITCRSGGHRVALSGSCTVSEYGDPFTTMGGADRRHDHSLHLAQLGYLATGAAKTITASGTYSLEHASSSTGIRVLRVARGDGTWFYLEYRRPYGKLYDDFSRKAAVVRGVSIRIGADWGAIVQTKLVDTRPWTSTFADAALRVDRTLRDYLSGVSITVVGRNRTKAWVKVTIPADRTPPTAPGSFTATATSTSDVTLAWSPATDNRALAGYRIWRDGALVATATAATTTYADASLAPETAYQYTIRAVDTSGNVGPGVLAVATTLPVDDPPSAPLASIREQNAQWAVVSWTAATDDDGVVEYRVLRNGVLKAVVGPDLLEAKVPRDSAIYVVIAVDTAGNLSSPSNEVQLPPT